MQRGFTIWLTGLSGAGKSTLARASAEVLCQHGLSTEILDGDEIRTVISRDLGFSKPDREKNVRRISAIAQFLSENGTCVIVAAISPYRQLREEARNAHSAPFVEVFVDCPKDELFRRDPKGLYARARQGTLSNLSGVSDPYEEPLAPDLLIRTDLETVRESVARIMAELQARGLVELTIDWNSVTLQRRA